ncbi:transferase [Lithospermum erythrorhizon]|uniref:Sulfotransferase n=1 Tax=Lithospermum erythrorhizon TaxID=34254 RepID=A0AAV3RBD9_LITER
MKSGTIPLVRRLGDFLGYGFSTKEEDSGLVDAIVKMCSFENLSTLEVNSSGSKKLRVGVDNNDLFRKRKVGDWKNHLSAEMANQIDGVTQQKFHGSGLLEQKPAAFSNSKS